MKNVTIAIDDATHKAARVYAAQHGTSLSALVKGYLDQLGNAPATQGVREMPMSYFALPPVAPPVKKARQPGGLRGKIGMSDDFNEWPADILASFEAWDDSKLDPLP
jgi:Family of unknown function (DUF6364)